MWKHPLAYQWRQSAHINVLELLALLQGLKWRGRSAAALGSRLCCFVDSQVAISVAAKGRSSSKALNRVIKRINSFCLAADIHPFFVYVRSKLNPADAPSRIAKARTRAIAARTVKLTPSRAGLK